MSETPSNIFGLSYGKFEPKLTYLYDTTISGYRSATENDFPKTNRTYYTHFGEVLGATRTSELNLKPIWGTSQLRDIIASEGANSTVTEVNGELMVRAGGFRK